MDIIKQINDGKKAVREAIRISNIINKWCYDFNENKVVLSDDENLNEDDCFLDIIEESMENIALNLITGSYSGGVEWQTLTTLKQEYFNYSDEQLEEVSNERKRILDNRYNIHISNTEVIKRNVINTIINHNQQINDKFRNTHGYKDERVITYKDNKILIKDNKNNIFAAYYYSDIYNRFVCGCDLDIQIKDNNYLTVSKKVMSFIRNYFYEYTDLTSENIY